MLSGAGPDRLMPKLRIPAAEIKDRRRHKPRFLGRKARGGVAPVPLFAYGIGGGLGVGGKGR
jgi:hypothetical protein